MTWPFKKKKKSRQDRVKKFSERMIAARDSTDDKKPDKPKPRPRVSDQHNIPDLSGDLELASDVELADIVSSSDLTEPVPGAAGGDMRSASEILRQLDGPVPAKAGSDILDAPLDDELIIDTSLGKTDSRDRLEEVDLEIDGEGDLDDLDMVVNMTPKHAPAQTKQPPRKVAPASARQGLSDDQVRIGRLLLAEGPFTRDALRDELEAAGRLASPIAQVLLNTGAPEESAILSLLLKNYRIPKVRLDGFRIPQNLRSVLPRDILHKYRMIPIDLVGDILCVAVENVYTFPVEALGEISRRSGYRAKIFSGDAANITRLLGTAAPAAGKKLKPVKVKAGRLKKLVPVSSHTGSSAASFRYTYCGPGTLKPIPAER